MKTSIRCYACGIRGHLAKDCEKKNKTNSKTRCWTCGEIGHRQSDCELRHQSQLRITRHEKKVTIKATSDKFCTFRRKSVDTIITNIARGAIKKTLTRIADIKQLRSQPPIANFTVKKDPKKDPFWQWIPIKGPFEDRIKRLRQELARQKEMDKKEENKDNEPPPLVNILDEDSDSDESVSE